MRKKIVSRKEICYYCGRSYWKGCVQNTIIPTCDSCKIWNDEQAKIETNDIIENERKEMDMLKKKDLDGKATEPKKPIKPELPLQTIQKVYNITDDILNIAKNIHPNISKEHIYVDIGDEYHQDYIFLHISVPNSIYEQECEQYEKDLIKYEGELKKWQEDIRRHKKELKIKDLEEKLKKLKNEA